MSFQAMRASLLASATATSFGGLRLRSCSSQGENEGEIAAAEDNEFVEAEKGTEEERVER